MTGDSKILSTPALYVFSISHYCEKARWALAYLGVEHEVRCIAPGFHMRLKKKYGLAATSLPILISGDEVVQGSAAIIDWAESISTLEQTLTPENDSAECCEIEKRLDDVVGVHTRRFFYSEALIEHPEHVKPAFLNGIPAVQKLLLHLMWFRIRPLMTERMDLGPEQWEDSRQILESEMEWLDSMLSDGRRYLVGEQFSRADLTAASLLSRLSGPSEHPDAEHMYLPPRTLRQRQEWYDRPCLSWIRDLYRLHRLP